MPQGAESARAFNSVIGCDALLDVVLCWCSDVVRLGSDVRRAGSESCRWTRRGLERERDEKKGAAERVDKAGPCVVRCLRRAPTLVFW